MWSIHIISVHMSVWYFQTCHVNMFLVGRNTRTEYSLKLRPNYFNVGGTKANTSAVSHRINAVGTRHTVSVIYSTSKFVPSKNIRQLFSLSHWRSCFPPYIPLVNWAYTVPTHVDREITVVIVQRTIGVPSGASPKPWQSRRSCNITQVLEKSMLSVDNSPPTQP